MAQFIYRKLRGKGAWKVTDRAHSDGSAPEFNSLFAKDVTFRVSRASWERCLRQANDPTTNKSWDVHAFAIGTIVDEVPLLTVTPITYDKNGCGSFIRKDTKQPITYCEYVEFASDGHTYAIGAIR